jgi:hypothetical protein
MGFSEDKTKYRLRNEPGGPDTHLTISAESDAVQKDSA